MIEERRKVLVVGASGFVGRRLLPELVDAGHQVRACARRAPERLPFEAEWVACDLLQPKTLEPALAGRDAAYYLVHSMGGGRRDFRELDRQAAENFAAAAAEAGLERIIYLGGVAPRGRPSEHLASRLEVGQILRQGDVPTLELRASMLIGPGSASWRIVRDLSLRLPAMTLPAWLRSKTRPIAVEDAILALVNALDVALPESRVYDIPGPETLSGRDILMRIAALRGRRIPALSLPWLTPKLSALWLRLVTRADYDLARELVMGLVEDLLPADESYWELTGHPPRIPFDDAARRALAAEPPAGEKEGKWIRAERLVDRLGRRLLPSEGR